MILYNMLDAKNNLSKICQMVVNNEEDYIIIASNGKPLVKVVPYQKEENRKLGILKGKCKFDDAMFDAVDKEIAASFYEKETL